MYSGNLRLRTQIAIWLTLALTFGIANSQVPITGAGKGTPAPAGYQGPGDIVSFDIWHGLQAYSAAGRGFPLINVCDTATGLTCADFSSDATTGKLVLQTIGGAACAAIGCSIKIMYDQVGTACGGGACTLNAGGGGVAAWPTLNTTGSSGNPTLSCSAASSQTMASGANTPVLAQPFSFSAVGKSPGTGTNIYGYAGGGGGVTIGFNATAANQAHIYAGTVTSGTASDASYHALQGIFNGASSDINIDGTSNVGNAGTAGTPINSQVLVCAFLFGAVYDANSGEFGLKLGTSFSGATMSALSTLAHSRWGF